MKKLLLTTASAGLIAMAGPVLAQTGGAAPGTGSPSMERGTTSPGATGAQQREGTGPGTPGAAGTGAMQDATPPADVVGRTLRGAEGENIGEIEAIEGNNVIVSVGGFLGIGERDVAIPWSEVTMMGSGADAELQTSLTRDQIRDMPEYERGTGATGTTPRGGATGGGGTTR